MIGRILVFGYDWATRLAAIAGYATGPRVVTDERPCPSCGALTEEAVRCGTCDFEIGVGD